MRLKLVAAAALLGCGLVATAQDAPTVLYKSVDGGYSVRFPADLKLTTKSQDAPGGLKMVMTTGERDKKTFVAMYMALPEGAVKAATARAILDGAANGALAKSGGKEISQKDFKSGPGKHPARELVVEKDGALVCTHIIVTEPKVFVLVVGGPDGFGTSKPATAFLKSFEITPPKD